MPFCRGTVMQGHFLKALVDGREKTPVLLGTTEGQEEGMLLKLLDLAEGEQKVESCIFLR